MGRTLSALLPLSLVPRMLETRAEQETQLGAGSASAWQSGSVLRLAPACELALPSTLPLGRVPAPMLWSVPEPGAEQATRSAPAPRLESRSALPSDRWVL